MASYLCHQNGHKEPREVVVIMVPLPLQGHLNQLLHLSRLISAHQISIHYVGSTTSNRQVKLRLHGWDPQTSSRIQFHDFHLPSFHTPHLDPNSPTKFPAHLQPVFDVCSDLRQPFTQLLQTLSLKFKRLVIIHDSLMGAVVQDVNSVPNAESYTFHTVSAFSLFFFMWELFGKPIRVDDDVPKYVPANEGCFTSELTEFIDRQYKFSSFNSGRLYNTSRVIERRYMNLLNRLPFNAGKKLYAIGPLNPIVFANGSTKCRDKCLEWLDRQEEDSVIYVSFGTTTSLPDEQIKELAIGLEKSGQKFIWAVRDADEADIFEKAEDARRDRLPDGFEERVRGKGMVVRDWAPQLEILGHASTGGFLSHCGWNSCMESISMGVPIAAWPMHSDQPKNTILVTEALKIGIVVKDWTKRNQVVKASVVENAVRRLMASKEGEEMRERAKDLGCDVRGSVGKGGSSKLEMDSFISHITR
ncbi:hypothetical protein Ancab_031030 [Ancistrocladus abbreviatus]